MNLFLKKDIKTIISPKRKKRKKQSRIDKFNEENKKLRKKNEN